MIDYIQGTVRAVAEQEISMLPTGSGIGYSITVAQPTQYLQGQQREVFCYQHYTQDHGLQLFGFTTEVDKQLFLLVLDCAGIGPKMALALVAQLDATILLAAIHDHDSKVLSAVPGIGAKKAEQLLLYLKHKTDRLIALAPAGATTGSAAAIAQVGQALAALGYKPQEVQRVVAQLYATVGTNTATFDELMRAAFTVIPTMQSR